MSDEKIPSAENEKISSSDVIMQTVVVLAIIAVGCGVMAYFLLNKPKAPRKAPGELITVVEVQKLQKADHPTTITAMGTVIPDMEIDLAARVGGEVIYVSPDLIPGGRFTKGQKILEIDPSDYKLVVEESKSKVAEAEKALKVEMGQQSIAKKELELLGDKVQPEDIELVLRQPHLKMAQADLEAAKAALQKAQLDLKRTTVVSPFNASIEANTANMGSQVSSGESLATLIGTDAFHIEVSVPVDRLPWLELPEDGKKGSEVIIYNHAAWGDKTRTGNVIRLLPTLETQGRMAKLLIEVQDPFALKKENAGKPKLILNMYVQVDIKGKDMKNVFHVNSSSIHDGDCVYLFAPAEDSSHRLKIKKINLIWRDGADVFIRNSLKDGDYIVTNDIATPVEGMKLVLPNTAPKAPDAQEDIKAVKDE